ncbi:hypothetical protein VBD025_04705 [Virgibacillus flavescens]|uniref:hypothetical protein n=1 Tax=Virgibacillus flavescens TaxID=1611422 RepID=UPI003D345260
MDKPSLSALQNIQSGDRELRYEGFIKLQATTNSRVDWAYEAWDDLMSDLTHSDNHRRAIATQLLCNLAKSDPEQRMLRDFPRILTVTKDERFVTARHTLQALWKVGIVSPVYQELVMKGFEERYIESIDEKNYTLIRYDIIQGIKTMYDEVMDPSIKEKALELIAKEEDPKYKKKYQTVWKNV